MVRELKGLLQGKTALTFKYNDDEGEWQIVIPSSLSSGRYILELWATDYAENTTYWGDVIITWDSKSMEITVEFVDFYDESIMWLDNIKKLSGKHSLKGGGS